MTSGKSIWQYMWNINIPKRAIVGTWSEVYFYILGIKVWDSKDAPEHLNNCPYKFYVIILCFRMSHYLNAIKGLHFHKTNTGKKCTGKLVEFTKGFKIIHEKNCRLYHLQTNWTSRTIAFSFLKHLSPWVKLLQVLPYNRWRLNFFLNISNHPRIYSIIVLPISLSV